MIKRANQKKKKGFSLIELIIVLAVMAIIALIAIPNFNSVREKSKEKADNQSKQTIERTVETLVAGEIVATPTTKETYIISFTNNDFSAITKSGAASALPETDELVKALNGTKKPNSGTTFEFEIDANGDVTVDIK